MIWLYVAYLNYYYYAYAYNLSTQCLIPVLKAFKEKFEEACTNNDVKAIVIAGKVCMIMRQR